METLLINDCDGYKGRASGSHSAIGFDYLHICVGEMGNTPISIDFVPNFDELNFILLQVQSQFLMVKKPL